MAILKSMKNPTVAFFAMPQEGHFQNLRPLIAGLAARGVETYVFTDRAFEADINRAGGTLVDVFAMYPLDAADDESIPRPCRYVSFAGFYAEQLLTDLEDLRPSLIVYDEHAVIGRVVGAALGVPYVSVAPSHNVHPSRVPTLLRTLPEPHISPNCDRAVATLRERFGVRDASPFSWASGLSPFLNVYSEPPAYLTEADRRAFEPVAFHGCLASIGEMEGRRSASGPSYFEPGTTELKVYVSLGTVAGRYWPGEVLDVLGAVSRAIAQMRGVRAVISLGGAELEPEASAALGNSSVSVAGYVDQWRILQEADAFVTHSGPRSTHEAIFNGVPMISYPFFWDQPALAEKCRLFGLAIPLTDSPRDPVGVEDVNTAFAKLAAQRESMRASLAEARDWELAVIADRDSVLDRITDLFQA